MAAASFFGAIKSRYSDFRILGGVHRVDNNRQAGIVVVRGYKRDIERLVPSCRIDDIRQRLSFDPAFEIVAKKVGYVIFPIYHIAGSVRRDDHVL